MHALLHTLNPSIHCKKYAKTCTLPYYRIYNSPISRCLSSSTTSTTTTSLNQTKYHTLFAGVVGVYLKKISQRHMELSNILSNNSNLSNKELTDIGREYSNLGKIVSLMADRDVVVKNLAELKQLEIETTSVGSTGSNSTSDNHAMMELVDAEKFECMKELSEVEGVLIKTLTPTDDADGKSVVLEVRAGKIHTHRYTYMHTTNYTLKVLEVMRLHCLLVNY